MLAVMIWLVTLSDGYSATIKETQEFLQGHRHAWLPYPFPFETSTNELARLLTYDFDTIGLLFAGSYNGGNIDFSTLDGAIEMVAAKGKKVTLHFTPRFEESDGISDRLSDGSTIKNNPHKNPNASMIDVFDQRQRDKFCDYLELCARRYGKDPRVAGFVVGWGYMGETGFYIGDYLTDFNRIGSVASGYSAHALEEFNRWRRKEHLPELSELPMPSVVGPSRDYVLFHRFRNEFAGGVFQKEAVARMKAHTHKPVGTFGYISVNVANYGRDWAPTPNVDFYRTAASAASFDLHRTLADSGVGWEDSELHDGKWNFTLACLQRDIARQIAHGAVFHAMPVRVYETEPQWETNLFPRLAAFLISQHLADEVRRVPAEIALFQPTWAAAALPVRSAVNPFVPRADVQRHLSKMVGLVESFGLPYELITERELLSPAALRRFHHIIVPMWNLMPQVLGEKRQAELARDSRIIPIPLKHEPESRSEFRELLRRQGIATRLDFEGEKIRAGRVNNLVFNWTDQPIKIKIPESDQQFLLQAMDYRFLPAPAGR